MVNSQAKKAKGKAVAHKGKAKPVAKKKLLPKELSSKRTASKISASKRGASKTAAKKTTIKKPVSKPSSAPKKSVVAKTLAKPASSKAAPKPARVQKPAGVPEQIRDVALQVLDERQADEVFTVDLTGKSSMADYLIVASGRASRQLSAIAHYLREAFEKLGLRNIRVEGLADANWVLVDAGDVIVHLFRPEVREYYNLESMWGNKKATAETEE